MEDGEGGPPALIDRCRHGPPQLAKNVALTKGATRAGGKHECAALRVRAASLVGQEHCRERGWKLDGAPRLFGLERLAPALAIYLVGEVDRRIVRVVQVEVGPDE